MLEVSESEKVPCKRSKLHRDFDGDTDPRNSKIYLHHLVISPLPKNTVAIQFIQNSKQSSLPPALKVSDASGVNNLTAKLETFVEVAGFNNPESGDQVRESGTEEAPATVANGCTECFSFALHRRDHPLISWNEYFENASQQNSDLQSTNGLQYTFLREASLVIKRLLEQHSIDCGFIGTGFYPGVMLPGILLGIMEGGCGFYPLDYKRPISESGGARSIVQFDWIIVDPSYFKHNVLEDASHILKIALYHQIRLNTNENTFVCFLVKLHVFQNHGISGDVHFFPYKYAYAMRTSGSTGNRRVVLVPHQAIVLNVLDFCSIFKVSSNDVVLSIAPVTFDPSIIDLFITLNAGGKLIYLADEIKLIPAEVAKIIIEQKVTILQCTPSFLLRFEKSVLQTLVFHPLKSQLRILALGGEKCLNKSYFHEIISPDKQQSLQIFNLYGVTEVSCWASVSRIDLSASAEAPGNFSDEISVGSPLSSTILKLLPSSSAQSTASGDAEGEMLIGCEGVRECKVFNEKYGTIIEPFKTDSDDCDGHKYKFFQTGDYMKKITRNCTEKGDEIIHYYFLNRTDRIRKRNGVKVDLSVIEKEALATDLFSIAVCLDYHKKILLLLKRKESELHKDDVVSQLHAKLKSKLYFENHPDRILILNLQQDVPLNANGKLDIRCFLNMTTLERNNSYDVPSKNTIQDLSCSSVVTKSFTIDDNQFEQIFNTLWSFNTRSSPSSVPANDANESFLACGGNSLSATRFVEEFFDKIGKFGTNLHIQNEKFLITELLCQTYAVAKDSFRKIQNKSNYCCQFVVLNGTSNESLEEVPKSKTSQVSNATKQREYDEMALRRSSFKLSPEFAVGRTLSFPVGLCVDAAPVIAPHPIHGQICIIGSHSGSVHAFSMPELAKILLLSIDSPCKKFFQSESEAGGEGNLPALAWHKFLPDRIESTITIHSGQCSDYFGYLGCHDGRLYKISTINGAIEWSFYSDSEIRSSPTLSEDGTCIIFSTPYTVYCVDSNSGTIRWIKRLDSYILQTCSAVVSLTSVFLSTVNGILAMLLQDGKVLWRSAHKNVCTTPLLVPNKNIIVFGDRNGSICALDHMNGNLVWSTERTLGRKGVLSAPNYLVYHQCLANALHNDCSGAIFYSTQNGTIVGLHPKSGQELVRTCVGKECRSKPLLIHLDQTIVPEYDCDSGPVSLQGTRNPELNGIGRCCCCCLINSQDGCMYSVLLSWESLECADDSVKGKDKGSSVNSRELFRFGQDRAESFSSPAFDFNHNILAVGSRDNCVHFTKLS